jgi:hypothetical protein
MFIIDVFKSRRRLEAENLFLRHAPGERPLSLPQTKTADRDRESADTRSR